ncbi:hypothetical protein BdWA1_002699 [Babesia duncani]|uniref:Uncharacterized protein n=1 Tax=Babesia duncani TaxID=323732 RepID=A0AAD9PJY9_9APIC|nr:hypothetical protein BdWA1_002699 [Babesia duncani]
MKDKELNILSDDSSKSIHECLKRLSADLNVEFDFNDTQKPASTSNVDELALSAPRYPKISFFPDGVLNVSLANKSVYTEFIRDARQYRVEEVIMSKRYNQHRFLETDLIKVQSALDKKLPQVIKTSPPQMLIEILRHMYLSKFSIRSENLVQLSNKALTAIGNMEPTELVELALVLHGLGDPNTKYLSLAISLQLEKMLNNMINEASCSNIVNLLLPLALIHHSKTGISCSILKNANLLKYISEEFTKLPFQSKINAVGILAVVNRLGIIEEHLNSFTDAIVNIKDKDIVVLLYVSDSLSKYPNLKIEIYKHALALSNLVPAKLLANVFLRLTPSETDKIYLDYRATLEKRLKELDGTTLANVYCNYLASNKNTRGEDKAFEWAIRYKGITLKMKDIANILMYVSIHSAKKNYILPVLIHWFNNLKKHGNAKYDEVLDVVLSMSLLGLHRSNVWQSVDLQHMTYSIPINILVYLGFAYLITNERSNHIWNVVLERLLYESKHHTAEAYEVLKSAEILEFIKLDSDSHLRKRMDNILASCKSLHLAKLARQRHKCPAPIENVLQLTGLQYHRGLF